MRTLLTAASPLALLACLAAGCRTDAGDLDSAVEPDAESRVDGGATTQDAAGPRGDAGSGGSDQDASVFVDATSGRDMGTVVDAVVPMRDGGDMDALPPLPDGGSGVDAAAPNDVGTASDANAPDAMADAAGGDADGGIAADAAEPVDAVAADASPLEPDYLAMAERICLAAYECDPYPCDIAPFEGCEEARRFSVRVEGCCETYADSVPACVEDVFQAFRQNAFNCAEFGGQDCETERGCLDFAAGDLACPGISGSLVFPLCVFVNPSVLKCEECGD